ncbi:hypothetical protein ACP3TB_21705 (plasmid) [Rahnella variigena]|uniref:hypothetical protein n=1 Tax=Rahnella variigena TaxID=574964 RepID=UPI003CF5384E
MNKIIFPCETAVIFRDVIYPVTFNSKKDISEGLEMAVRWFESNQTATVKAIKKSMLVSFLGLYLNYEQSMERVA